MFLFFFFLLSSTTEVNKKWKEEKKIAQFDQFVFDSVSCFYIFIFVLVYLYRNIKLKRFKTNRIRNFDVPAYVSHKAGQRLTMIVLFFFSNVAKILRFTRASETVNETRELTESLFVLKYLS